MNLSELDVYIQSTNFFNTIYQFSDKTGLKKSLSKILNEFDILGIAAVSLDRIPCILQIFNYYKQKSKNWYPEKSKQDI